MTGRQKPLFVPLDLPRKCEPYPFPHFQEELRQSEGPDVFPPEEKEDKEAGSPSRALKKGFLEP